MSEHSQPVTDFDGLLRIATELRDGWEEFTSASTEFAFGQRNRRPDEGRFISVYGLAAHVHNLARPAFQLLADDLTLEAIPIVRLMYESALTSVWLAQNEEGARAFVNKEIASRKTLAKTLAKAQAPWLRKGADHFPGLEDPKFESGSDAQSKNFEQLCSDLTPGGADAYTMYRLLSRLSHASPQIVDRYTFAGPNGNFKGLRADADKTRESRELITYFAVASLVWAGTAVDYIDPARVRRSETREAARKIGTPRDLHLTPEARQRIASATGQWKKKGRVHKRPAP
jgi:hypothetical protein